MSIREIHQELLQINTTELKEFYKMYVPRFCLNTMNMKGGHLYKDLEIALGDRDLNFEGTDLDIIAGFTISVPASNKIESYWIDMVKTNLLGEGLNIVFIFFERPLFKVDSANMDGGAKITTEPYYLLTGDRDEDLVMAVDLSYIENTPFTPMFYVIRGMIEFIKSLPHQDIHIDRTWDKTELEMMISLTACEIIYEDGALHVLEEMLMNDPDIFDEDKEEYLDIIKEMWDYFDNDYNGKYYRSDIIVEE